MDKVFILEQGTDYEGSSVLGIYASEDAALRDLAVAYNKRFDRYSEYLPEEFAVEMMPVWCELGLSFQSGCDYWLIDSRRIEK
jgi:hypothetical protein